LVGAVLWDFFFRRVPQNCSNSKRLGMAPKKEDIAGQFKRGWKNGGLPHNKKKSPVGKVSTELKLG